MTRFFSSLLFAWALFVGPALCMGGLLEHDCPCDQEEQCEHEESCPDDPCETFASPGARVVNGCVDLEILDVPLALPGTDLGARAPWLLTRWQTSLPPDRPNWPYISQNRPLLI